MVRICCVKGCKNSSDTLNDVSYFNFPLNNEQLKQLWLNNGPGYKRITKYSCVCSDHFLPEDYVKFNTSGRRKLIKNAVPGVFANNVPEFVKCEISDLPISSHQCDASPPSSNDHKRDEEDDERPAKRFCSVAVQTCFQLGGSSVSVQTCPRLSGPSDREKELMHKIRILQDRLRYKEKRIKSVQDLVTRLKESGECSDNNNKRSKNNRRYTPEM